MSPGGRPFAIRLGARSVRIHGQAVGQLHYCTRFADASWHHNSALWMLPYGYLASTSHQITDHESDACAICSPTATTLTIDPSCNHPALAVRPRTVRQSAQTNIYSINNTQNSESGVGPSWTQQLLNGLAWRRPFPFHSSSNTTNPHSIQNMTSQCHQCTHLRFTSIQTTHP